MGVGDALARWVYNDQPIKFAAIELVPKTSDDVPETLLGRLNSQGQVTGRHPDPRPRLLAVRPEHRQVHGRPGPRQRTPSATSPTISEVNVVHLALGRHGGTRHAAVPALPLVRRELGDTQTDADQPGFLSLAAASGVLSVITMEAGWVVTEVGRQPWIVYNYMKVEDAATANTGVWITFIVVTLLYLAPRHHHDPGAARDGTPVPPGGRLRRRRQSLCAVGRREPVTTRGRRRSVR